VLFAILALVAVFISLPSHSPRQTLPRAQEFQPAEQPAPLPPPRRLENGTALKELSRAGNGRLTIDNGTGHDAVIKLVDERARQLVVAFYIRGGQQVTVDQIPDGAFQVIFASGADWDSAAGAFTREKSFARFDQSLDFVTTSDARSYEYSVFTLTLHRVVHGNAKTTNVGEQEFLKY
jgi:hypothetical protein